MKKENKRANKIETKNGYIFFFFKSLPTLLRTLQKNKKKKIRTLIKYTTLKIRNEEIHNEKRRKIRQNQNKLTSPPPTACVL